MGHLQKSRNGHIKVLYASLSLAFRLSLGQVLSLIECGVSPCRELSNDVAALMMGNKLVIEFD